jgi:hypothetical protein
MRLYGYPKDADADEPVTLDEVTVTASPSTLRRLAEFFLYVADEMDRHGPAFGHEHFGDYAREMRSAPAGIVVRDTEGSE